MSKIGDIAIGFVIGVGSVLGLGFWLDKKEKEKAVDPDSSNNVEPETSDATSEVDDYSVDATQASANSSGVKDVNFEKCATDKKSDATS